MTICREVVKVETTKLGHGRVLLDDGSRLHGVISVDVEIRPGSLGVLVIRVPIVPVEVDSVDERLT